MTDYTELVKALRSASTVSTAWEKLMHDAAAAIEELLPKRGEWIGVAPDTDTVQCSVCGYNLYSEELETPYCPYCGARMEVQE